MCNPRDTSSAWYIEFIAGWLLAMGTELNDCQLLALPPATIPWELPCEVNGGGELTGVDGLDP